MGTTMTRRIGAALGAVVVVATLAACEPGNGCADGDSKGRPLEVVALTSDQQLLCFEDDTPEDATTIGGILGFDLDNYLIGIDYRPASGDLYGVGNNGGIYTIDELDAGLTLRSRMDKPLTAIDYGVDFNPAVDRLRLIGDDGQNLRVNVDTGATTVDGTLTYPANPPSAPSATTGTGITGAAYTNNDTSPNTGTTLFDIDATLDQVVIQSPANSGLLAATGKLGVDTTRAVGFDIYSTVSGGRTTSVTAFASLNVGGSARFYRVNLLDGMVSSRGAFDLDVYDIALPLNQA